MDRRGVGWSLVGFAAAGLSGLVLNLVITEAYSATVLGRFNILLAVFIVGGQIGSAGVHAAVLYHTPRARSLGHSTLHVLGTALKLNLASSGICTALVVAGGSVAMSALDNSVYARGLLAISAGLFLYPLNKSMLAYVNGMGRIRAFAALYALRYLLLVGAVGALAVVDSPGSWLPIAVSATEAVLAIVLAFVVITSGRAPRAADGTREAHLASRLLRFGARGMGGGLLLDLNTRVDVLILGSIAGSRAVGRYSIASIFAEGLYQLAMVFRFSFDPVVTTLHVEHRHDELRATIRRGKRLIGFTIGPLALLTIGAYPFVADVLFGDDLGRDTWSIYAVLATGVAVTAGYIPFTGVLQQTGHPTDHTLLLGMIAVTSVTANLVLVPWLGAVGAACGTALAQLSLIPYLRRLSRKRLGFAL